MLSELSLELAEYHGKQAASESARVDDPYLQSWVMMMSAWDYLRRGLTDRGRARALELQHRGAKINDPRALGMGLWLLGWLDLIDERYEDAFQRGEECVRVALTPFDRELGLSIVGIANIFLGRPDKGEKLLWEVRKRTSGHGFVYMSCGTDAPLGVAMVLRGAISAGLKFIEEAIDRYKRSENQMETDLARMYLAEVYIALLAPPEMPPLRVVVRNLYCLARTRATGRKKAARLLTEAGANALFVGNSHYNARINTDLGLLHKIAKRYDEAQRFLETARPIAEALGSATLVGKIDTALRDLRPS
jgi:hypothetical protein